MATIKQPSKQVMQSLNKISRSETAKLVQTLSPAFRSNVAAMLQGLAARNITTAIGARLVTSLARINCSHPIYNHSKI